MLGRRSNRPRSSSQCPSASSRPQKGNRFPSCGQPLSGIIPLIPRGARLPTSFGLTKRKGFRARGSTRGAITYELWVDEEEGFPSPRIYSDLADTSYALPDPLSPMTAYRWRVIAEEPDGYRRLAREDRQIETPQATDVTDLPPTNGRWVLRATPNPSRSGTVLRWYAPAGSARQEIRLTILDPAGRRLHRERRTVANAGWNETTWDPRSADGATLPPGVYLALLEAPGYTARTKIVLAR